MPKRKPASNTDLKPDLNTAPEPQDGPQDSADAPPPPTPTPPQELAPRVNLDDLNPETGYPWTRQERRAAKGLHKPLPKTDTTPSEHMVRGLALVGIKGFAKPPAEETAVEWSERAGRRLLPEAMAVIALTLRSKNEKLALDAAEKVLRMNGVSQKEALQGGNATLIVNLGRDGSQALQWLKPTKKTPATVQVVPTGSEGDDE